MKTINIKRDTSGLSAVEWDQLFRRIHALSEYSGVKKGVLVARILTAGLPEVEKSLMT